MEGGGRREREKQLWPLIRTLIPPQAPHPHDLITPEVPPQNATILGHRISTYEF